MQVTQAKQTDRIYNGEGSTSPGLFQSLMYVQKYTNELDLIT